VTIALAALLLAVPTFVFVLWPLWARRDPTFEVSADATRAELEADKALALRAIRDLELDHETGHLAEDDYAALRSKYETRALAVLRQLDALGPERPRRGGRRPAPADQAAPAPLSAAAGPWSRQPIFLAGGAVGLVVFGVILGVLVVRFTGPAPPDPMAETGPGPMAAMPPPSGMPPATGPEGPPAPGGAPRPIPKGMLEGMLQAARASLNAGRMQEAIAAYQAILKREPDNADALAHFGLILAMAGHADRAIEHFDRALRIDPNYPEALSYSAQVRFELKQDYPGAIAAWERFATVVDSAEAKQEAQNRIREARSRMAAGPAATAPERPPAAGATTPRGASKP
jgi:cytochrome c-type biogenesis protein CcmH/NrfG